MPTTVVDDPLGISCVFSDGRSAEFDLSDLPNPRLTRDLATALVELIHPHGSADSRSTVDGYVAALRAMVRALAEQGFTGGADGLRRGQLAQSWMAGPTRLEALTRGLVEGYARSGGVLGDRGLVAFAHDEVAFPVPGHSAVVGFGRPVADHDHRVDEPMGASIRGPVRFASRTSGPKCLLHLPFQPAPGLKVQCLVDRFVAYPHAFVVGKVPAESVRDLLR
jgi:hypothetical protein